MVERVAHLLKQGVESRRILVIQYNTKAKDTMQAKLSKRLKGLNPPEARTFHSVGLKMRNYLVQMGALDPATLLTGNKETRYVRKILRKAWIAANGKESFLPEDVAKQFPEFITLMKAGTLPAHKVFMDRGFGIECLPFISAFDLLETETQQDRVMFYDDQLYHPYKALRDDPSLWRHFTGVYEHLIVDEFQDANPIQFWLMQGICGLIPYDVMAVDGSGRMVEATPPVAQCMVVGDGDQAIYRFRGSDPNIIHHEFERSFTPATRYPMTRTFRYGHETALLANNLICRNRERDDKITVSSQSCPDTRIHMRTFKQDAPTGIVRLLTPAWRDERLHRVAMLVRYYSMIVPYELELISAGMPYHVYGRQPLMQIDEIASLAGALFLATNYWTVEDDERQSFFRAMLKVPSLFLTEEDLTDFSVDMEKASLSGAMLAPVLRRHADLIRQKDARKAMRLRERADTFDVLQSGALASAKPGVILQAYMNSTGLTMQLASQVGKKDQEEVQRNIKAFVATAEKYESIVDLLDKLGARAGKRAKDPPEESHLGIYSIHGSKGEEWPTVILPGWTQDTFPRSAEEIEEERRLAYVAVTRAINNLIFLHPEDAAFSEFCTDLETVPNRREIRTSQFLLEAEPGIATRVAAALRDQQKADVTCRLANIGNRYLRDVGNADIRLTTPPSLAKLLSAASNPAKPASLKIGQSVFWRDRGKVDEYIVQQQWSDDIYQVRHMLTGESRVMALQDTGWTMTPTA